MGDRAQELVGVTFLLQRVIVRAGADDFEATGPELPALSLAGRRDELALEPDRGAGGGGFQLVIAGAVGADDALQRLEAGTVVEFDEGEVLGVAPGAHPAAHVERAGRAVGIQQVLDGAALLHRSQSGS